jgi:hypothetical protein
MLNKIIILIVLLSAVIGGLNYATKRFNMVDQLEEKVEDQNQTIGVQNEVIQKNQDVHKRKAVAKDTSVTSDLDWLRNN